MGNPMMAQMGQQGGTPAWTLIEQLKQDFEVKHVEMTADKIDDDVKVLLVILPKDISDQAQYAIDQFVLRGGKLIAFLDAAIRAGQPPAKSHVRRNGRRLGRRSTNCCKAWGIQFDTGKVVADLNFKMQLGGRDGQPTEAPAFLALTAEGINTNDVVTSDLDNIWLPLAAPSPASRRRA